LAQQSKIHIIVSGQVLERLHALHCIACIKTVVIGSNETTACCDRFLGLTNDVKKFSVSKLWLATSSLPLQQQMLL